MKDKKCKREGGERQQDDKRGAGEKKKELKTGGKKTRERNCP